MLAAEARKGGVSPSTKWANWANAKRLSWEKVKHNEVFVQYPSEKMSQGQLIGLINAEMKEGDTLVAAAGTIPADLTKLFDSHGGKNVHIEFGNSSIILKILLDLGLKFKLIKLFLFDISRRFSLYFFIAF